MSVRKTFCPCLREERILEAIQEKKLVREMCVPAAQEIMAGWQKLYNKHFHIFVRHRGIILSCSMEQIPS